MLPVIVVTRNIDLVPNLVGYWWSESLCKNDHPSQEPGLAPPLTQKNKSSSSNIGIFMLEGIFTMAIPWGFCHQWKPTSRNSIFSSFVVAGRNKLGRQRYVAWMRYLFHILYPWNNIRYTLAHKGLLLYWYWALYWIGPTCTWYQQVLYQNQHDFI